MERLTSKKSWDEASKDLANEYGYKHIWERLNAIENRLPEDYNVDDVRYNSRTYKLQLHESVNEYGVPHYQNIFDMQEEENLFSVCDLCECPEDAMIVRDLFSADEYIEAVKLGMEIAQNGYTDIEVETITDQE